MFETRDSYVISGRTIGRTDLNDFEAVLAMTNTDPNEVIHVRGQCGMHLYLGLRKSVRPQLAKLYEKAKVGQWNGETDLPWDTDVDQEARPVWKNTRQTVAPERLWISLELELNHGAVTNGFDSRWSRRTGP